MHMLNYILILCLGTSSTRSLKSSMKGRQYFMNKTLLEDSGDQWHILHKLPGIGLLKYVLSNDALIFLSNCLGLAQNLKFNGK